MQNKYMNLSAPVPQMGAAPQMNHQQFAQANMTTFANFGAKAAPVKKVEKKNGLKENVKKYWPLIAIGGVVGYKQYTESQKSTPAPAPTPARK